MELKNLQKEINFKNVFGSKQGITLIALVITIIVLLILAGVTIAALTGDNGILTKATSSVVESELGSITDSLNLYLSNQVINTTLNNSDKSTLSILKENGIIDNNNNINTQKLLNSKTKYGNGSEDERDVYKIVGNRVVYIDSNKNTISDRPTNISTNDFITLWSVDANDTIVLPIAYKSIGGSENDNNFTVDWGDGSQEKVEGLLDERPSHTYSKAGEYSITISGVCKYFTFDTLYDSYPEVLKKLIKIVKWGEINAKKYNFIVATNLESVPSPQTCSFKNISDDSFDYMFSGCSKLESIPSDLFKNISDISSFKYTFENCTSLKAIPADLFFNATDAKSFKGVFYGCTSLKELPSNLFLHTTKATDFESAFYNCYNITSIPENIFDNVLNITNLKYTFSTLLKITSVPKFWKRSTSGLDGTSCFEYCNSVDTSNFDEAIVNTWFTHH